MTDPKSIASPSDPQAVPVPIDDLVFSRGVFNSTWSADGRQLFISPTSPAATTSGGMDTAGSWPVQMTQSDDNQGGLAVSPDGRTLFYTQGEGGNELYRHLCGSDRRGRGPGTWTNTPDLRESSLLVAPDGRAMALSTKAKSEGQINLAVMDIARRPGFVR